MALVTRGIAKDGRLTFKPLSDAGYPSPVIVFRKDYTLTWYWDEEWVVSVLPIGGNFYLSGGTTCSVEMVGSTITIKEGTAVVWAGTDTGTTAAGVWQTDSDAQFVSFQSLDTGVAYPITPSSAGAGSIDPSIVVNVAEGATQVFTFTPNAGYRVGGVVVDGVNVGTPASYSFTNVTAPHTLSVLFDVPVVDAEHGSWVDLGPAPSAAKKDLFTAGDYVTEGETIYYDPADTSRVHIPQPARLIQTDAGVGIRNVPAGDGDMFVTSWLASTVTEAFTVEVETYCARQLDAALVWYTSESLYAHTSKLNADTPYIRPLNQSIKQLSWPSAAHGVLSNVGRWVKRGYSYRYDHDTGHGYLRPFAQTATGIYWGDDVSVGDVRGHPAAVCAFHIWNAGDSPAAMRNLRVASGQLNAYSFEPSRIAGIMASRSVLVNGSREWVYQPAPNHHYRNGPVRMFMPVDGEGYWDVADGTNGCRLEFPASDVPSGTATLRLRTSPNVKWRIESESGQLLKSGTSTGVTTVPLDDVAASRIKPVVVLDAADTAYWLELSSAVFDRPPAATSALMLGAGL